MFEISTLTIYSLHGEEHTYVFKQGINYFKGNNNTGKTEFYKFIDYMFGSSEKLNQKPWYTQVFKKATMVFNYKGIFYKATRTKEVDENYFTYLNEEDSEIIDSKEYKSKMNSIFSNGEPHVLRDIKSFTNENLTYRTFTMFNFLGEKRQGVTYNFLDKCSDIKYYSKLNSILNYIFNNNLEKITELQEKLKILQGELKEQEVQFARNEFIKDQVNKNLIKLDISKFYTGRNKEEISLLVNQYKQLVDLKEKKKSQNIINLEINYNSVSEQIRIYENKLSDMKQIEIENANRKVLLNNLNVLLEGNETFGYLVNPLKGLLNELDDSMSFSKYLINDITLGELKEKRELLKKDIRNNNSRFNIYSLEEKSKFIALIEEYLSTNIIPVEGRLEETKKVIRDIKNSLKVLQDSDDPKKINRMSEYITDLYKSAARVSNVVREDIDNRGFEILYLKKGNGLQPVVKQLKDGEEEVVNYYVGSMARHTLIQLSGYLAFLKFMLEDGKYPLIPLLVIDHVSKPFDDHNKKSIGEIVTKAYESIGKENLQIFIFDDEDNKNLNMNPDHVENLVTEDKTGFVPFYNPNLEQE